MNSIVTMANRCPSNVENLLRKTARFVKQYYSKYNHVARMIHIVGWKNIKDRRKHIILTMLHAVDLGLNPVRGLTQVTPMHE